MKWNGEGRGEERRNARINNYAASSFWRFLCIFLSMTTTLKLDKRHVSGHAICAGVCFGLRSMVQQTFCLLIDLCVCVSRSPLFYSFHFTRRCRCRCVNSFLSKMSVFAPELCSHFSLVRSYFFFSPRLRYVRRSWIFVETQDNVDCMKKNRFSLFSFVARTVIVAASVYSMLKIKRKKLQFFASVCTDFLLFNLR